MRKNIKIFSDFYCDWGIVNYYCSKILEYIKDRKIIRFFFFFQVCGVHVSIKQGKCIDT